MSTQTIALAPATTAVPVARSGRRRVAWAAAATALYAWLIVLVGGTVRITGSGLGCGDDWPRCNGQIVPVMSVETFIEFSHRVLAAGFALPYALLLFVLLRQRAAPWVGGPGGVMRPVLIAGVLVVVQALLGALTVKLELPAGVTALHFVTAMLIVAALVVAAVRAGYAPVGLAGVARRFGPAATAAAALALVVVAFGALTANLGIVGASTAPSQAALACQGFPFCNGQLLPAGVATVQVHWVHRLVAFLLALHVFAAAARLLRAAAPPAVRRAAGLAALLVAAQIGVAAALVLLHLPDSLRVLHLAVGGAVWAAVVAWAAVARIADRSTGERAPNSA